MEHWWREQGPDHSDNRQKVDYRPLVTFEHEEIREILEQSRAFLQEMERLVYGVDGV
jgi:uncharacterized protein (UPF0332 family)